MPRRAAAHDEKTATEQDDGQQQQQQQEQVLVGGGAVQMNAHSERGELSSWATEGMRRVRQEQVYKRMTFLTGMAAIGGFLFGYDTGVISGAMLPIQRAFQLNNFQEEVVVSSTVLAAFVSSVVGGNLNQSLGRRRCILAAAAIFTAGSVLLFGAMNYASLVLGRVVVGVGIGIASLTTPMYIAEVYVQNHTNIGIHTPIIVSWHDILEYRSRFLVFFISRSDFFLFIQCCAPNAWTFGHGECFFGNPRSIHSRNCRWYF